MKQLKTMLTAMLLLCCTTMSAHDFEVDGIYYNITGAKTVEVTYGGTSYSSAKSYSGSVTIPSSVTYNGTTYSVTTIGKLAFYGCSNLTSITIPNSVTTIEPAAFEHCRSLTSIEIPNGVTIIAGETFYACASLRRIEIPNSITTIETWAFNGCSSLSSIEIPSNVTTIGEGAFIGCYGLTNITVDENNLAYDSRNNCNAIIETASNTLVSGCQTTIIPNSVTAIGNYAFSDCKSLASIEIPNTVTTIGYWAFASCSSLKSIEIPNTVTTIGENTFSDCSSLTSVVIPNSVTTIGNSAFSGCSSLTSIVIPGSVTTIGDWTFSSCSSLTSISVAAGNTTYDSRDNCNAIIETASNTLISGCKNTVIPSSVTTIGYGAFHGCTSPSIVIPNSVTTIGDYAFKDCSSLTSITSYITADKLIVPGRYAFSGIDKNNCTLYVPAGAKETYAATEGWSEFRNIFELSGECGENAYWKFDTKNSTLTIYGEGATYDYQSAESPWNDFKREIKSIEIESGITAIGDYTIYGCTEATSISIPNTVTKIGDYGIYQLWNLQSLTIPNSVTEVGEFAFATLVSIEEIHIPASLASIGASAFGGCNSLETITVDSSNPYYNSNNNCNAIIETATNALIMGCKNTIIPDNVTKIGKHAFTQLGVGPVATGGPTSITIPAGVTEIGDYAFSQCSKLETVISHIPADRLFTPGYLAFNDLHPNCTLYVPAGAKETYAATEGWNEFTNIVEMIENPFELTVSAARYATLYLDYNAIIPEGVEVYTANTVDGNRLMMQQVTGTLPANTGVIVRAEQGTYTFELSFDEAEAIESNLFRGSVEDEYITPEKNAKYYVLSMKDGVVGMYEDALTGGMFKNNAHKAYLVLSPKIGIYDEEVDTEDPGMQLSNSYYFDFGGTTAIDPVVTECEENVYYDLNGRRVENPTRGIYILNGKKILVK